MKKTFALIVLAAVVGLEACGSSSPKDDCDAIAEAGCKRIFACLSGVELTAVEKLEGFTSESDCVTKLETNAHCSSYADNPCPSGQSYDSTPADDCVNAINKETCSQVQMGQSPGSCSSLGASTFCK